MIGVRRSGSERLGCQRTGAPTTGATAFVIRQVVVHDYIFQVIAAVGGVLVNVDSTESCPTAAIQEALDDDTAAVVHYLGKQTLEQLAEVVAVAEPRSIPVIVDAAAQLPPRSNLTEPVRLGAGLVVFSGGKALRGSQSSGLVVGKEELIEAARMNGSPASSVGPRQEGRQGGADGPARCRGALSGRQ